MKIGMYDPYLDDLGGGEKYMMTIASCLSQEHEVTVFWNRKEDFYAVRDRFGLDVSRVHLAENIFASEYGFFKRFFATRKYDALIFLSDGSIPFSLSRKLFIHIQQPLEQLQKGSLKDAYKISRVTRFFCNSAYTKSFIDKSFHLKTRLLYPPVSLHVKKTTKENTILHVGRFRVKNIAMGDYKKQGFMVDAFIALVRKGLKNWKLVIATGNISKEAEKEFIALQKKAKGFPVEFLVDKSNKELWSMYNKAKIYWHASGFGEDLTRHPEYAEHFGISTVEAMGAGCVPVVINAGGQREIVTEGENGLLWDTEEALLAKTQQVITDRKLWRRLSTNAQERAKDFSEEMFCKKLREMIGEK